MTKTAQISFPKLTLAQFEATIGSGAKTEGIPAHVVPQMYANYSYFYDNYFTPDTDIKAKIKDDRVIFDQLVAEAEADEDMHNELQVAWEGLQFMALLNSVKLGGEFQIAWARNILEAKLATVDASATAFTALMVFFEQRRAAEDEADTIGDVANSLAA